MELEQYDEESLEHNEPYVGISEWQTYNSLNDEIERESIKLLSLSRSRVVYRAFFFSYQLSNH